MFLYFAARPIQSPNEPRCRGFLKEAHGLRAIAHKQVLGLLIVIENHLVGFAAETRLLVTAEGRAGGIHVVAVGPHASRFDLTTHAIQIVRVARPYARTQSIDCVVADLDGIVDGP